MAAKRTPSVVLSEVLSEEIAIQDPESLYPELPKLPIRATPLKVDLDSGEPLSGGACATLQKIQEPCEPEQACGKLGFLLPETDDDDTSGLEVALEIVKDLLKRATKPKKVRKGPKIVWPCTAVKLEDFLPKFYLDNTTCERLCFAETLLVSTFKGAADGAPKPVGALRIDVQSARGGPFSDDRVVPKFLVHLSSQFEFMGVHHGGSRITAWVDKSLQTIEERRKEYVKIEDKMDEQSLYINSQENFYYLRHDKEQEIIYSMDRAKNLICEGASFILMRYLAISCFVGSFELATLYIDGSLCRNIYDCKGPSSGIVNNNRVDVCKIYRTIVEENGIQHKAVTLMSLQGQILTQEWYTCDYILQINPLVEINNENIVYNKIPLDKQPIDQDLQLLSLYLDAKTRSSKYVSNYMEDYPEIKELLADYLQHILQLKPENILEFSAKYFLSYTPSLLQYSEYFERAPIDDDDDEDTWKYI